MTRAWTPVVAAAIALGLILVPCGVSAQWRTRGSEMSVGGEYKGWDDTRPAWREANVAARHNTRYGAGIARLSHVERGSLGDDKLELEAYPLFRGGYAVLGAGIGGDGSVYARSTWMAELYRSLTPHWESSAGVRRMHFASSLTMLTGSLGRYHRDYLFATRVNHALNDGTSVALTARRYFGNEPEQYVGAVLAGGSAPAQLRTATDMDVHDSRSIGAEAQLVIESRWVLRMRAELGREGPDGRRASTYSGASVGLGVRF